MTHLSAYGTVALDFTVRSVASMTPLFEIRPAAARALARLGRLVTACGVVAALVACPIAPGQQPPAAEGSRPRAVPADDDFEQKAAILQSSRWRRAVFELGEWLSGQQIYTPQQVHQMKADFNRRVAAMSADELDKLLDDLEMKFKVMDSPEAKDAREWVGQYLSAMSDARRQQALRDVPDVVAMSAGQLAEEIKRIEQRRDSLRQRQQDFDQTRRAQVAGAQANRQATAQAIASAQALAGSSAAYSPYSRPKNDGKLPFSNVNRNAGIFGFGFGFGGPIIGLGSTCLVGRVPLGAEQARSRAWRMTGPASRGVSLAGE